MAKSRDVKYPAPRQRRTFIVRPEADRFNGFADLSGFSGAGPVGVLMSDIRHGWKGRPLEDIGTDRGSRALVVDDDPQIQDVLSRLLGRHGFEVVKADSAEKGYRKLVRSGPFRYVLLDHDLGPGNDGTWLSGKIVDLFASKPRWFKRTTFVVISLNRDSAPRMTSTLKRAGLRVRRIPKTRLIEILTYYRRK